MNLMDLLPNDPEQLHKLAHSVLTKAKRTETRIRLRPVSKAMQKCICECGGVLGNDEMEFCITMAAIATIDNMIEAYYEQQQKS